MAIMVITQFLHFAIVLGTVRYNTVKQRISLILCETATSVLVFVSNICFNQEIMGKESKERLIDGLVDIHVWLLNTYVFAFITLEIASVI
jgi:hypothetical protein